MATNIPTVKTKLTDGNLGRVEQTEDGTALLVGSAIAVENKITLGSVLGPFRELAEVEAAGITEDYDDTNSLMLHQHAKEFYDEGGKGRTLYILPLAQTVTLEDMADKSKENAAKVIRDLEGEIKLLLLTRVPDSGYTPEYVDELPDEVWDAADAVKALYEEEAELGRRFRCIIEGRDFQGNASSAKDLRHKVNGLNNPYVVIGIGQDYDYADSATYRNNYASVARMLGRMAAVKVNRNIGRVKDGPMNIDVAALSDHSLISDYTDTQLETLNEFGYVFWIRHRGQAGYFINNDHAACPIDSDYAYISRGRVMDKVARIADQVYTLELKDEPALDPESGRLAVATIKDFEGNVEQAINSLMTANREITSVSAFADPAQNVLANDEIRIEINVVPTGRGDNFIITLAYSNPAN